MTTDLQTEKTRKAILDNLEHALLHAGGDGPFDTTVVNVHDLRQACRTLKLCEGLLRQAEPSYANKTANAPAIATKIAELLDEEQIDAADLKAVAVTLADAFDFTDEERELFAQQSICSRT
jgi:hypothetical protein